MTPRFAGRMDRVQPSAIRELLALGADPSIISFGGGYPDASLFPAGQLAAVFREVILAPGGGAMQYAPSDGLPRLREHAATEGLHLDIRFCGSVDAIRALNEGRCTLAGFHTQSQPTETSHTANAYKDLLKPGLHKIIGFATRTQGLITAAGNPKKLHSLADVVSTQARFVQRSQGTGTRVLLDDLLAQAKLNLHELNNWPDEEPSHTALAEAIASGRCDVGLGIESTARARGLGFSPLVEEQFHLVCLKSALETPTTQALREILQSPSWLTMLDSLPGYHAQGSGHIQSLNQLLPWWTFSKQKKSTVKR
jgi:molybdate-binding protein